MGGGLLGQSTGTNRSGEVGAHDETNPRRDKFGRRRSATDGSGERQRRDASDEGVCKWTERPRMALDALDLGVDVAGGGGLGVVLMSKTRGQGIKNSFSTRCPGSRLQTPDRWPSGSETPEIGVSVATELGCMAQPNRPGGSRGCHRGASGKSPREGNRETWTSISDSPGIISSLNAPARPSSRTPSTPVVRVCS